MSKSCIRVLVIIFNILFVIIGLTLLGLALWVFLDSRFEQYKGLNKDVFNILLFVVMGVGGLTTLIALCGCCGALYMSPCLLGVFFFLLLIIFLLELGVALLGFFASATIKQFVNSSSTFMVEDARDNLAKMKLLNATQSLLQCCGDSRHINAFDENKFPSTCCKSDSTTTNICRKKDINAHWEMNCTDKMISLFNKYNIYVLAFLLAVAAVELFGMIFAMILCCHVRRYEDEGYVGVHT